MLNLTILFLLAVSGYFAAFAWQMPSNVKHHLAFGLAIVVMIAGFFASVNAATGAGSLFAILITVGGVVLTCTLGLQKITNLE